MNLQQLRAEAADPTPVKDHGWQEAFEAIYPLKINELRVTGGRVTYIDEGPSPRSRPGLRPTGGHREHRPPGVAVHI